MGYDDRVLGGVVRQNLQGKWFWSTTEIPQRRAEHEEKVKSLGTGTVGCVVLTKMEK
jgi:L-asparaginase